MNWNFDSDFAFLLLTDQPLTNWWALRLRMLQAAIYILIPKCCGSACSGDQCAVSLRLAGVFVVVARPPVTWRWKVFDLVVLSISALSGPFCILLLPVVLVYWWVRRELSG